ncbi:NAD-dependent epimerase/dehydratase family protein [Parapedobacter koreensis]|uniref:NAD dependent epimerase/dehydratase family protein n=1 Tax=Parapedobacter koreensis TaxID=332977 RepID=A0A1H7LVR3_9SPHI|nr:NAD-dependent epimerase/dehydratase family protein [Parapedobacter koreensis]SEL03031.1 NAD dependent epimerase/dehydratase family protein [Parapedobacter koreensis]
MSEKKISIILTGATGLVGEGILMECLQNSDVSEILSISRKSCNLQHPKLKELIVPDFVRLRDYERTIKGYDACFYCAGISSAGLSEEKYHYITYDTTIAFANAVLKANPDMSFCFVSGRSTDSTEKGRVMWARVKGKAENTLKEMPFKSEYNFRPAGMLPFPEQKNAKFSYKLIVKLIRLFAPASVLTLSEVGKAMINAVKQNYHQNILEVKDIKTVAQ